jgi:hypothetical protein
MILPVSEQKWLAALSISLALSFIFICSARPNSKCSLRTSHLDGPSSMIDIRRYVKTHGELNLKPPMLAVIESSDSPTWKGLVSPHLQGYLHVT